MQKIIFIAILLVAGCAGAPFQEEGLLSLPYLKNSGNECYYLDEFMPVPNNLVSGKSGSTSLRYYTYLGANYKDWKNQKQVILSFYSHDGTCWSLYEELAIPK